MSLFFLMWRNDRVLTVTFENGEMAQLTGIQDREHVPVGCRDVQGQTDIEHIRSWWNRRISFLKRLYHTDDDVFPGVTLGYSPFDSYWLQSEHTGCLAWSNRMLCLVGNGIASNVSFGLIEAADRGAEHVGVTHTYNSTLLRWDNDALVWYQDGYNERIAAALGDRMRFSCQPIVSMERTDGKARTMCRFCWDPSLEFISAADILVDGGMERADAKRKTTYLKRFCERESLDGTAYLDQMFLLDYLMRNTRRSWDSVGFLWDREQGVYVDFMPLFLYDHGLFCGEKLVLADSDGVSNLTGFPLEQDLGLIEIMTSEMKDAVGRFPGIVRKILEPSGMPRSRKMLLACAAEHRRDTAGGGTGHTREKRREGEWDGLGRT